MARLHPQLQPFDVQSEGPFDSVKAAHLLNRAGFGGTLQEIDKVKELGPLKAVEWLLDFPDAPAEELSKTDVPDLSSIDGYPRTFAERREMIEGKTPEERQAFQQKLQNANREAIQATVGWWMRRMAFGPYPLQEKLTFLWHGHFTTSARDERSAWLMWQQNELLRRQAAGNFREFVHGISRDPAMLDYLNNGQNRKKHPNENYARELMELFTLGIGHYTENDIKEAARAFTGWTHDGDSYFFRKNDHDYDEKKFLGVSGDLDGDDVVDIILKQKACAPYIAGKLLSWFACENPEPDLCQSLGELIRDSRWDLRPALYTLLTSKCFYSDKSIGTQVKSPVQLVVGTIRMMDLEMPPPRQLAGAMDQMGQIPFAPPNVKGWPGGRTWINTSTLFVRYNTCVNLVKGGEATTGGRIARRLFGRARRDDGAEVQVELGSPQQIVDHWLARLIQRPIDPQKRQTLLETISGRTVDENAVRSMIQLIVSMPEYQLC